MSEVKRVLAIDLGASGGKCFAGRFDADGFGMTEVHRFSHEAVSFHVRDRRGRLAERTFWDDTLLYDNVVRGLQAYRHRVGPRIDAVGIDAWGADGQVVDADGECLGKLYAYRDHRLDNMIEAVQARLDAERIYGITGICFQPFNVSNQLHWLALHRPDMLRPGVSYLPVPALFGYYLTGEKAIDSSWASVTQVMDARTREWSAEILTALDVPRELMPPIVAPGATIGALLEPVAAQAGLAPARLIAVGSHDTASAFAAAPIERADEALIISSGTWSLAGKLIPEPITLPACMAAKISNEGGIGNIRFLKNCMGTWLAQELRRVWRLEDRREMAWEEMNALAAAAPPFAALIDPDDGGFYNPADMQAAIVEFCGRTGQKPPADRGGMLRTVYESLALKYRMVNAQICRFSGTSSSVINIIGGGSKNDLLNQFAANACGLPVIAGPEEATAVGNIMVQAVGLGVIDGTRSALPMIRRAFPIRDFEPRDTAAWDEAYARFVGVTAKSATTKV